ncbi:12468_t:CDS:2 [Rhizophagus irregularis]|nr:12468_t:CDS:2 [Rhizophagus irregularis]
MNQIHTGKIIKDWNEHEGRCYERICQASVQMELSLTGRKYKDENNQG